MKPTIFADVNNDMRIAREEVFGPVLSIIPFDTEEEAIAIANDTAYGLAAYVQTGDPDRADRVASRLRAGMVHINGATHRYGSPFGGYKQSGNGREGGIFGLEDFLRSKLCITQHECSLSLCIQTGSSSNSVIQRQHSRPHQFWAGATVHCSFQHLEAVDLPFRLTVAPGSSIAF